MMKICLLIIPWGFGFVEIHRYAGFFYTGCDRPSISAWLSALRVVGLLLPLSFLSLYFKKVEYLFFARLTADIISGTVAWYLARRMVFRLPAQDGEVDPK